MTITILRESDGSVQDFVITREIIHVDDIKDPHIIDDHIGYVRLTEFRENSYNELHQALEKLKAQGADSLILDLRNNPGGLLDVAIRSLKIFCLQARRSFQLKAGILPKTTWPSPKITAGIFWIGRWW